MFVFFQVYLIFLQIYTNFIRFQTFEKGNTFLYENAEGALKTKMAHSNESEQAIFYVT